MRIRTAIVACISLLAAAFLLTGCGEKHADISGTVYSFVYPPSGSYTPLSGSDVALIEGMSTIDTQMTDIGGEYSFARVDPGTYTVRAYMDKVNFPQPGMSECRVDSGAWTPPTGAGYVSPFYMEYSGLTVAAGDEVTVDFRLAGY
jgi:hypothetical protein